MDRRQFVLSTALAGLGLGLGSELWPSVAYGAVPTEHERTLLNIFLAGGPDFRHLFVPAFDKDPESYGYLYWSSRFRAHGLTADSATWETRYKEAYLPVTSGGVTFGILKKAKWLHDQFKVGNVAIICNVAAAVSRDHSHATLVFDSGDRKTKPGDLTRDGWGGRLAKNVGGRVVSMTNSVRLFCNGPHPTDPTRHDNGHVISAVDTRKISLYHAPELAKSPGSGTTRAALSRSLSSYYAAKAKELPDHSPYRPFVDHEHTLRKFGELVEKRLAAVPEPKTLNSLYTGTNKLASANFGKQLRNTFDSFACADIFDFRVGSLAYGGWDSHKGQAAGIEPKLSDLFGAGRGLDTLTARLQETMPKANDNTVMVIGGEFGRQLRDNGDGGTDHGRGNIVLVVGQPVKGGVYGDMFPQTELALYAKGGKDIKGETAVERIFAVVADWLGAGAGTNVFPNHKEAPIEKGVDLSKLI